MGRAALTGNIDVIQPLHSGDQFALKPLGHGACLETPCHDVDIVFGQQILEPVKFCLAPFAVVAIKETADHEIRLTRATMPGAELRAGEPGFEGGHIGHAGGVCHSRQRRKPV